MKWSLNVVFVLAVLLAGAPAAEPTQVNPYKGTQDREEVFEFAREPAVQRQGEKYVITFVSKGRCDATVSILSRDGRIVRHLASGVLGINAPHPFRQNSLLQRIEWDGTDDAGAPAPAGCSVRVGLGLKAEFERNIGYDPYDMPTGTGGSQLAKVRAAKGRYLVAGAATGEIHVLALPAKGGYIGRVFGADGAYVRTFWPPSAREVTKLSAFGYRFAATTWGEPSLVCGRYGPAGYTGDPRKLRLAELGKVMFAVAGIDEYREAPRPAAIPHAKSTWANRWVYGAHFIRMAADRLREEVYIGSPRRMLRFDGRTGAIDETWFPDGGLTRVTECHVGPDGRLYIRIGTFGYGQWIARLDHEGKPMNFGGDAVPMPRKTWADTGKPIYGGWPRPKAFSKVDDLKVLWTGLRSHSNVHERGLFVSPRGHVLAAVQYMDAEWAMKHGVPRDARKKGEDRVDGSYVALWDRDGKLLTANAVGNMQNGHGVAMDRDGNIYAAMGGRLPAGQKTIDGIVSERLSQSMWGSYGSLLKFPGGRPLPRGRAHFGKEIPPGAVRLAGYRSGPTGIEGTAWIYGGLCCQTPDICTCHNVRYDMDYFARHWLPANHLYSVLVLDANANRIVRIGRYGTPDDEGIRFVWPRALCVSDTALYVADPSSRRILKAALGYHAQRTVELPR